MKELNTPSIHNSHNYIKSMFYASGQALLTFIPGIVGGKTIFPLSASPVCVCVFNSETFVKNLVQHLSCAFQ